MAKGKKCNHDCFNCIHDDCIVETLSSEDRKEIRERDNRYYKLTTPVKVLNYRPKKRGMRYSSVY